MPPSTPPENIYLTIPCPFCKETGVIKARKSWLPDIECYDCKGMGKLPSQTGNDIIELIKLHYPRGVI